MKKNRGVTLIELVTVMVIIGILTMIAAPSLQVFMANQKLITLSSDTAHAISLARNQARTTAAQIQMTWTYDSSDTNKITGWTYDFSQAAIDAAAAVTADTNFKVAGDPQTNYLGALNGYSIQQCDGSTATPATTLLLFNANGTIQMVASKKSLDGPASIKFSSTKTPTVRTLTFAPSGNVNLAVTSNPNYKSAQPAC